ncbi:MAG: acyl-ACP--UDP-N-acetylglucosamine O-acyltransferase, partial [Calditrichaeota bacterium]|nr:acyl-ACP--UDP-N-acetylglucosamine O-acyltransferase [Calditrichota bacterium]
MSHPASARIHPTAVVSGLARIGEYVEIGPFAVIEDDVEIGDHSRIASGVLLASGARIGRECRVSKGAVIGTEPQDLKFGGEQSEARIGDRTVIREFATVNRGTAHGHKLTSVGSDCMLMAYSHIAHDCAVGDHVILANAVNLAGHVTIGEWASIGGVVAVHQFCRIGRHAFIGGFSRVAQDVPPYILTTGDPLAYYGPNKIGLKRRGFSDDQILAIKRTYTRIYRSGKGLREAIESIGSDFPESREALEIADFCTGSKRGIIGLKSRAS